MNLPIQPPYPPMEALLVDRIPEGPEWQYEPKWDGFRCLAFRDHDEVFLQSKSGQPLARYFPEVVQCLRESPALRFVLDGELVIPVEGSLSFDDLLLRLHPAESRVRKLAAEHPALLIVFDLLVDERGKLRTADPLADRRAALEQFFAMGGRRSSRAGKRKEPPGLSPAGLRLSPATRDLAEAKRWFLTAGPALDGVIAKPVDLDYRSGERSGMQKVKNHRSADCVVGGFRYGQGKRAIGSLLLGLYDDAGQLHHVGHCSGLKARERESLVATLKPLIQSPGFTGTAPGGPSRWAPERDTAWEPLAPKLVVEVSYDHFTGGRFRHGTRLLRWRPDKAPRQCTMEQVAVPSTGLMTLLHGASSS